MAVIALTSTHGSGFLETDFDQIKTALDGAPTTLTGTELGYCDGVTSAIQTQIDTKLVKQFDPAPADHTYSGIVVSLTAGENLAITEVGYFKSDGKVWKAKADAESTSGSCMIVMATAAINQNDAGIFLIKGFFQDASAFNFTVGKPQYIDASTGGALTETAPSTATQVARIVGYGKTADIIYFCPDTSYVVN